MDSKMTVFINGHRKPVHKVNDIHHRLGAPYKIPARSHTISGQRVEFAQRSTDSLPLTKDLLNFHTNPYYHASVTSAPQPARRVKSEHGSPTINALPMPLDNPIPPISIPPYDANAYSYSPFGGGSPTISSAGSNPWDNRFPEQFPESFFVSYERANEVETTASTAGGCSDPAEVNWSSYNIPNRFGSAADYRLSNGGAVPSQPPSYTSFDGFSHLSHPGLTSSSGDVSDVEDFVPIAEPTILQNSSQDVLNDFSSVGGDELTEPETFRLSSASSYVGMPQARMLASGNLDSLNIDEYLKSADAHTREMAFQQQRIQQQHQQNQQHQQRHLGQTPIASSMPNMFIHGSDSTRHAFSVQEAQEHAHAGSQDGIHGLGNPFMTTSSLRNDPIMSSPLSGVNNMMNGDERDDGWVR